MLFSHVVYYVNRAGLAYKLFRTAAPVPVNDSTYSIIVDAIDKSDDCLRILGGTLEYCLLNQVGLSQATLDALADAATAHYLTDQSDNTLAERHNAR